eukprot:458237-Pelagomonas_calceolata.AAC.8
MTSEKAFARSKKNTLPHRDFTPATSRQSISLRTREVSCSKRRAYRTARRTWKSAMKVEANTLYDTFV